MNKKKIFGSIAVLTIAAMAAFNINISSQENGLSDISLENVEALAGEHPLGDCKYNPGYKCCLLNPTGEDCTPWNWAWF